MSTMIAICTLDLHGTSNRPDKAKVYGAVEKAMKAAGLKKTVFSRERGRQIALPHNTYIGSFARGDTFPTAVALKRHLCATVKRSVREIHRHATLFIVVGGTWAWGRRRTK